LRPTGDDGIGSIVTVVFSVQNFVANVIFLYKFAWKELWHHRGLVFAFIFNLSLGLVGFLALDAFKTSVSSNLGERSKSILGADLVLSAKRELKLEELDLARSSLPQGAISREERSFFSMAWNGASSRLVEIRAIDEQFPYYGNLKLQKRGSVFNKDSQLLSQQPWVWVYPELAIQLDANLGDNLQLGQAAYIIDDIVESDPSVSNMSFSPAPKVFVSISQLPATGLLGLGSRQEHRWLVALPKNVEAEQWSKKLRSLFPQSDINIQTHHEASQQLSRLLNYLGDYLGLVSLVALFLSAVGTAYLFQSFVEIRQKQMATLSALGMPFPSIVKITLMQLGFMGLLASVFSILGSGFLLPQVPRIFGSMMVDQVQLTLGWRSLVLALLTGLGGAFFFSYPSFHRLALIKPSELFRETSSTVKPISSWYTWLPTLFLFWGLSIWQAQSWKVASIFMSLFILALIVIAATGALSFFLLEKFCGPWLPWIPRLALLQLSRCRRPTQACFLAIGLGTFLLILIPQLSDIMRQEVQLEGQDQRPTLFLFDIQPEQVEELKDFLSESPAQLQNCSPLVSARLLRIKGENIDLELDGFSREAERSRDFRNRGLNISSRLGLNTSERIVEGRPISEKYTSQQKVIEASLEFRYAQRLGLGLGDTFSVEVLGVVFEAVVVNLRKVRWTSFQPNFFVIFQSGALDDAPRTYLASLVDHRDKATIAKLQQNLVSAFPNIGVVDISQTIARLLEVVTQMLFALQVTSWVSILAGLGVLFSICRQQLRSRLRDLALIRLCGAQPRWTRSIVLIEFLCLGSLAGWIGLVCGCAASMALGWFLFDGALQVNLKTAVVQYGLIVLVTVLTGLLSSYRALGKNLVQLV
jgi:putative ABC transport system permease protein